MSRRFDRATIARCGATVVVALGLMVTWSLATARYAGPDEPAHVLRAAAVANGEFEGRPVPGLAPGFRAVVVPAVLASGDPSCFRHAARRPAVCAVAAEGIVGTARAATSAGTNPPLYYAMVGIPVRLLADPSQVVWYRIIAAAWCALALACALGRSRSIGPPGLVVAGLTPAAWFLFGVVNPNSLEISLAALAWVAVVRLLRAGTASAGEIAWFSVPAALAIAIRPIAVIAVAAMVVVVLVGRGGWRQVLRLVPSWQARTALLAPPLTAVLSIAAWTWWSSVDVNDPRTASTLSLLATLRRAVQDTSRTLRQMAGSLGWLEFSAPSVAQLSWWILIAVAGVLVLSNRSGIRWAWVSIAALLLAMPIVFEVTVAHRVGFIWQGRYSISTGIGLVIVGFGLGFDRCADTSGSRRVRLAVLVLPAIAEVATFWTALRRFTVGTDGSWWFTRAAWHPPLPPLVLVGVNAALFVALLLGLSLGLGDLAAHDVERGSGPEPLDLLGAEGVQTLEVDR